MDFESIVIAAMLAAAMLHALWHALVKSSLDPVSGLAGMNMVSGILGIALIPFVEPPNQAALVILLFSLIFHSGYKFAIAYMYKRGDLGQVLPIARGATPIMATAGAFLFVNELPTVPQSIGIAVICLGVFLIVRDRLGNRLSTRTLLMGGVAGVMVATYTITGGLGVRINQDWFAYTVWLFALDGGTFVLAASMVRGRALYRTVYREWRITVLTGLLGSASFGIFFWGMRVSPIGIVASLRETSILFATLIGVLLLREPLSMSRVMGAVSITGGVILFLAYKIS